MFVFVLFECIHSRDRLFILAMVYYWKLTSNTEIFRCLESGTFFSRFSIFLYANKLLSWCSLLWEHDQRHILLIFHLSAFQLIDRIATSCDSILSLSQNNKHSTFLFVSYWPKYVLIFRSAPTDKHRSSISLNLTRNQYDTPITHNAFSRKSFSTFMETRLLDQEDNFFFISLDSDPIRSDLAHFVERPISTINNSIFADSVRRSRSFCSDVTSPIRDASFEFFFWLSLDFSTGK